MAPASRRPTTTVGFSNLSAILCLVWIFSSTALAASAVIGIDFGTEYIKATLVKPGIPLDIVLTKDSRRKETSAVAFKPDRTGKTGEFPERSYGSDAVALAARFPGDVYPNLKALLGLPAGNSKVQEYAARHPALKVEAQRIKGTAAFRSGAFSADEEPWMVEEILAMELQSIQKNAIALAGQGSTIKDVVITIPPYFGAEEKRAIEFAADLAGLRVLSLFSDGLAVGLNYATTRTFPSVTDGAKPEYHLVFDMGAGSAKATVMKFQGRTVKDVGKFNKTIQEVQVLGTGWDRTLGGDALNAIIVDEMLAQFIESKGAKSASISLESVKGHGRAAAKLWKEAERIRQVLSANSDTQANFEGLYEDIDFKYKLSRAGFEKLSESFAERVAPVIEEAVLKAKLELEDLDSIILHGGAVRTPFIQKQLEKLVSSADKIRSNVNADEAAVFGAGFMGASLSPSFRVKEIRISDVVGYAIGMKWVNVYAKGAHQQLFNPESLTGKEKVVSFQNQKDFPLEFYQHIPSSENVSPNSAEKQIMRASFTNLTISTAELKEKNGCTDGDILLKVGVRLSTTNGEVEITKSELQCEVDEEEKKDSVVDSVKGLFGFGSKDKKSDQEVVSDAESAEDIKSESATTSSSTTSSISGTASASPLAKDDKPKITKRLVVIPIAYKIERMGYPQLEAKDITRMKDRLVSFDDSDRNKILREASLNELEGYTYHARDMIIDPGFISASTDAERKLLEEKAKGASEWLYGEGSDATRAELKANLKELKDIVGPIEVRRKENSLRPDQINAMKAALEQTKTFIDSVNQQVIENEAEDASSAASVSLSSSTSTSSSTSESSTASGDFDGLEDETTTSSSTSSSKTPTSTPKVPRYKRGDVDELVKKHEETEIWLNTKLKAQAKLGPTEDPVIFVKEMKEKTVELTTVSMDVIVAAMKISEAEREYANSKSSSKPKMPKTSKTKKPKKPKTKSGKQPKKTDIDVDPEQELGDLPIFELGEDGEMPSAEVIMERIKKQNEQAAKEEEEGQNTEKQKNHVVDEL